MKKPLATYQSLSATYYDLDDAHGATQELPFYLEYAQHAQGPILEPMCGTGNFLIPFTKAGFDIEGFDASPFMLERLHQKAEKEHVICKTWQGFIQDLSRPTQYNLIFIPNASFNLLIDDADIKVSLRKLWEHLAHQGKLVIEILTSHAMPIHINTWTHKARSLSDGHIIKVSSFTLPIENNIVTTKHHYELWIDNRLIKEEDELYKLKLYNPDEMEQMLQSAGFSSIKKIKAFDHTQTPDEYDDIIVLECIK